MLEKMSEVLFAVSTSLLVPAIVSLLALAGWTVLLLGGFARELAARRVVRRALGSTFRRLGRGEGRGALAAEIAAAMGALPEIGFLPRYLRACWAREGSGSSSAEGAIDELELGMARSVAALGTLGRLGPMLGLMGTLIPLGPALVELARGNLAALASQLVIAFSTTVVGLLIGVVAFACGQARRSWYARDLHDVLLLEDIRSGVGSAEAVP